MRLSDYRARREPLAELNYLHAARERGDVVSRFTRHLIFHCFPKRGCDWARFCWPVFRYRDVFNGRVLVSITSGADCDDATKVLDWFAQFGPDVECRVVPNVRSQGINTTFRDQLREIQNERGIVFKAHTKGISHLGDPFGQWRVNMADGCLADMPLVEQKFREGSRSFGVYRTVSPEGAEVMGQTRGPTKTEWAGWHFAGAFYWFDPRFLPQSFFKLPLHHYENEAFPCHLGPIETSFAVKPDNLLFVSKDVQPYFRELNQPLCEDELLAAAARGHL